MLPLSAGNSGFPVVEEGKLVGLITGKEVMRAVKSGKLKSRADEFMIKKPVFVSPLTSFHTVEEIMIKMEQ